MEPTIVICHWGPPLSVFDDMYLWKSLFHITVLLKGIVCTIMNCFLNTFWCSLTYHQQTIFSFSIHSMVILFLRIISNTLLCKQCCSVSRICGLWKNLSVLSGCFGSNFLAEGKKMFFIFVQIVFDLSVVAICSRFKTWRNIFSLTLAIQSYHLLHGC